MKNKIIICLIITIFVLLALLLNNCSFDNKITWKECDEGTMCLIEVENYTYWIGTNDINHISLCKCTPRDRDIFNFFREYGFREYEDGAPVFLKCEEGHLIMELRR